MNTSDRLPDDTEMRTQAELAAARARREALYQAIVGLEDALTTPVGEGERWRLRVAMAVDHASARIAEHIEQTERLDGMLDRVGREDPRLVQRTRQLVVDHERLEKQAEALAVDVAGLKVEDLATRADTIRERAVELLGELTRHRQRGADLIYEAYHVDIGQSA